MGVERDRRRPGRAVGWPITAGRPPSRTISTSRPSARSSPATAFALSSTCCWSKASSETLGIRTKRVQVQAHGRHQGGHPLLDLLDLVGSEDVFSNHWRISARLRLHGLHRIRAHAAVDARALGSVIIQSADRRYGEDGRLVGPFVAVACAVADLDLKRERSLAYVGELSEAGSRQRVWPHPRKPSGHRLGASRAALAARVVPLCARAAGDLGAVSPRGRGRACADALPGDRAQADPVLARCAGAEFAAAAVGAAIVTK